MTIPSGINNSRIKVSTITGETEGKIDLGKDREPVYAVDDITGQVYYLTGDKESCAGCVSF